MKAGYALDTSKAVPRVKIPTISAETLKAHQAEYTLVDLRLKSTREGLGDFPGALLIPVPELVQRYEEIPKDKPVVMLDYNGKQFPHAGPFLVHKGYKAVSGLQGGLMSWIAKGYPLAK